MPESEHPATWKFDYPVVHAETREQWRAWLQQNATAARGVWLLSWRAPTGLPRCPYPDAVEEAICFGWVDSTNTVLDEQLPGLEGLFFLGYSNPITGNIRQVSIDAKKIAKRAR